MPVSMAREVEVNLILPQVRLRQSPLRNMPMFWKYDSTNLYLKVSNQFFGK